VLLVGKVALVTGATGGLGCAIVAKLIANGSNLVIHYHSNEKSAKKLQNQFSEGFGDLIIVQADLTKCDEVERFNGRISDLVKQTRFASASELETTLVRYLTIYNHHIPQKALGYKTPIQSLKKWQAETPNYLLSAFITLRDLTSGIANRLSYRQKQIHKGMTPLKRLGVADDVACAVLYLSSELSNFITGEVITVSGGEVSWYL